jgi:hypothetical protein
MKVCLEFDDLGIDNHRLDLLQTLKEHFPNFKVTMFAIPAHCPDDWTATLPDWIELAFHGDTHSHREFENYSLKQTNEYVKKYADKQRFKKIFRAPYWLLSDSAYATLRFFDWKLCLHPEDPRKSDYTYTWNLKDNLPTTTLDIMCSGHGHIQPVCGNGLEESFDRIMELPKDAEFYFVSEVIAQTEALEEVKEEIRKGV